MFDGPIFGVAVEQGSGLEAALRKARGTTAREEDLLAFKLIVVETLSPDVTTLLVDSNLGSDQLPAFHSGWVKMLAYEADVYHISDDDHMMKLPDNLRVAESQSLGTEVLKIFLYDGPNDPADLNGRKAAPLEEIGKECVADGLAFLFEPIVYDRAIPDQTSAEYARAKANLVRAATAAFSDSRFNIDILKVEIPVSMAHVGPTMTEVETLGAFWDPAEPTGDVPILYLSAGVTFEQFREALRLSRKAGVEAKGFMCGRAIWSDTIGIFGADGPSEMARWMETTGRERLAALKDGIA